MYIEPNLNYEKFLKDYNAGVSARNLKEKYRLTGRQYRKLCTDNQLTRDYAYLKQNPSFKKKICTATYYSRIGNKYLIRKVFGNKTTSYGTYHFKEIAEYVVDELKKVDWDKKQLKKIVEKMKREEWYMNLFNAKIRSIRTTIEAEEMKERPNYETIRKLRKELNMLLKEVDWQ